MNAAFAKFGDDFLAEFPQGDRFDGEFRVSLVEADNVADGWIGVEPQNQIGPGQFEEVHRMRLDRLAHVHQFAQQTRGPRRFDAEDFVACLGRGEMVADRADAADSFGDQRHLVKHPAFTEFLEAAEFVDVKPRLRNVARVVKVDGDFRVTFDAGHRFDGDGVRHGRVNASRGFCRSTPVCGRRPIR